jgi:hypothetical protein
MDARSGTIFLALIVAQAAHSVEEYILRLYEVFTPARAVSSLAGGDPAAGFIVVNSALVVFGLWCYFARVRRRDPSARGWTWFWILLELGNGIGHLVIGLSRSEYSPGVITALPLVVLSVVLGTRLIWFQPHGGKAL